MTSEIKIKIKYENKSEINFSELTQKYPAEAERKGADVDLKKVNII